MRRFAFLASPARPTLVVANISKGGRGGIHKRRDFYFRKRRDWRNIGSAGHRAAILTAQTDAQVTGSSPVSRTYARRRGQRHALGTSEGVERTHHLHTLILTLVKNVISAEINQGTECRVSGQEPPVCKETPVKIQTANL